MPYRSTKRTPLESRIRQTGVYLGGFLVIVSVIWFAVDGVRFIASLLL